MPFSELIYCPFNHPEALPAFQKGGEIRYPPEAINILLEKLTQKGDRVFDPFTGFGTTFFLL